MFIALKVGPNLHKQVCPVKPNICLTSLGVSFGIGGFLMLCNISGKS